MEANNMKAICEALKRLLNLAYEVQDANSECEYGPKTSVPAQFVIDVAKSALAAPPRNCDVGDAADWEKRFGEECDRGHTCSGCPVKHAKTRMATELDKGASCEFVWAQMPYEGKEGGNDAD